MHSGSGSTRRLPGDLWRGAVVGIAVAAAFAAAATCAQYLLDAELADQSAADAANGSGVAVLGATVEFTLAVGLPAALLVALLVGWALCLPRPWGVPLVGLPLSLPLLCGLGGLVGRPDGPGQRWLLMAVSVAVAHAVAAVLVRPGPPAARPGAAG